MKEVLYSTQAKKDLKKYRHDYLKMSELYKVIQTLMNDEPLDKRYKAHNLIGKYKNCLECHIESDFLLIWIDQNKIYIQRIGSHAELF